MFLLARLARLSPIYFKLVFVPGFPLALRHLPPFHLIPNLATAHCCYGPGGNLMITFGIGMLASVLLDASNARLAYFYLNVSHDPQDTTNLSAAASAIAYSCLCHRLPMDTA